MSQGKFHSATSFVEANALFQFDFENVLGFYLESWGDKPLSDSQLENIAKNAAEIARELVYDQDAVDTGTLKESIRTDTSDGNINVFSDARAPNGYPYAGSVEYGWHPYGHYNFIPPRPFLRPALEYAINATRAEWSANVEYMVDALANNKLALSHFNHKTDVGASRRNWGKNIAERTSSKNTGRMKTAISSGRSRGKYAHSKNQERYGTEKQAYRSIWDVKGQYYRGYK